MAVSGRDFEDLRSGNAAAYPDRTPDDRDAVHPLTLLPGAG